MRCDNCHRRQEFRFINSLLVLSWIAYSFFLIAFLVLSNSLIPSSWFMATLNEDTNVGGIQPTMTPSVPFATKTPAAENTRSKARAAMTGQTTTPLSQGTKIPTPPGLKSAGRGFVWTSDVAPPPGNIQLPLPADGDAGQVSGLKIVEVGPEELGGANAEKRPVSSPLANCPDGKKARFSSWGGWSSSGHSSRAFPIHRFNSHSPGTLSIHEIVTCDRYYDSTCDPYCPSLPSFSHISGAFECCLPSQGSAV